MLHLSLISTPWPLFNRPSIQLGALKAFINQNLPQVRVELNHFYLRIAAGLDYRLYLPISERTWLSEAPFAALLYPEKEEIIGRFWQQQTSGIRSLKNEFRSILLRLSEISDYIVREQDWTRYRLIGFSICLGQLTSSIYFIRRIKKHAPEVKILTGGSACAGEMGRSLLEAVPEIDFVASGEGELPLLHVLQSLGSSPSGSSPSVRLEPIPGLFTRDFPEQVTAAEFSQVEDLNRLPIPDFSDYFRELSLLGEKKYFLPKLPMEISRGCWWRKRRGAVQSGCAFCNLNLQWQGYRAKSPERVVHEIDCLSSTYRVLAISFTDNLLPSRDLEGLFRRIQGIEKDLKLFAEIRATTRMEELTAMGAAGITEVQVGIEALSSRLLKKMRKGTTAIQNLEIMKNCETEGLPDLTGNLILLFPGSDSIDVEETLRTLQFVLPFRPLKGIPFWLGYGSPVWQSPWKYGIRRVRNHPYYGRLFPREVLVKLKLILQGYEGGVKAQGRLWRPVKQKLAEWKRNYSELHAGPGFNPILSYRDGGDFLIVRQRRLGKENMVHRMKGASRKIFLFCTRHRTRREILERFPGLGEEKVSPFLRMMVDKHLMFTEDDKFLSLAVPAVPPALR